MVHFGEAEVFEGEVAEAVDGFVRGEAAGADVIEELAKGSRVHGMAEVRGQIAEMNPDQAPERL
jgi:hypothetical protein